MESNNSLELPPVPPSPIIQSDKKGTKANEIATTTAIINLTAISILILYEGLVLKTNSWRNNPLLWAIPTILLILVCFITTIIGLVHSIIGILSQSQRKGRSIFGLITNGIIFLLFILIFGFDMLSISTGSLSGKVTLNYVPIKQLDISIANSKGEYHAITNEIGEYAFGIVETGEYKMMFIINIHDGYFCETKNNKFQIANLKSTIKGESILMVSSGGKSLAIRSFDQQISDIKIMCTSNSPATKNKGTFNDIFISEKLSD